MKVLVTGGAGYIGSHTLLVLLAAGHDITVLDNFENGSREALKRVTHLSNRNFDVAEGDIRDRVFLEEVFTRVRPDAVIHFAGRKAVTESIEDPLSYYGVNVSGSLRLLEAMTNIGCKQIVFSSSATVYGPPEFLPFDEDHPTRPINPYGRSKLMVEEILSDWCIANQEHKAISLRYFNPVGAHFSGCIGEDPKGIPSNLMPYITQTAVGRREALEIYGADYETRDGTGERDYVHVMDLADAHAAAIGKIGSISGHQVLNIGTGEGVTVQELIASFENVLGRKIPIRIGSRRPGDVGSSFADASRARTILNWTSKRTLNDMCLDSWAWQRKNPNGYLTS